MCVLPSNAASSGDRPQPQRRADERGAEGAGSLRRLREHLLVGGCGVAIRSPRHGQSDERGYQDHDRKRNPQNEQREEGKHRDDDMHRLLERPLRHPPERFGHQRDDGALQAEEHAHQPRQLPEGGIGRAQGEDDAEARQHEQDAGGQTATHAMQQPADIGRELLCFRPGQQHAEIECMQELRFADPFSLVDHEAVHEGDLACRPAEAEATDLEPELGCLGEGGMRVAHRAVSRCAVSFGGQACVSLVRSRCQR